MQAARAHVETRSQRRISTRDPELVPLPAADTAPGRRVDWRQLVKIWAPVALLLVLIDVSVPLWLWHVPKLTPPTADYGHQFLVDAHRLATAPAPPGTAQVLAMGSSIAGSFDPTQVRTLLAATLPTTPVAVDRLLLPGIKPSDLRLFFATEGASLRPDVAVVLLNPLDFLNPSFERDLKPQVRYVLPPWETLRERSAFIPTISGKVDLALASVSNLYRYRKLIRAALEDHGRYVLDQLSGRTPTGGYGVYDDGYARRELGVPLGDADAIDLEYYVAPQWIAQRGRVTLRFATAAGLLEERVESSPGWKRLHATLPAGHGPLLHIHADSAWSPRAASDNGDTRLLGIQLRGAPAGKATAAVRPPLRYPPAEREQPDDLLRMQGTSGEEFKTRWRALLESDTEFGRRFRAYREAKLAVRDQTVESTGEYAELERLVRLLSERGARVVLVNTPESSLLRDLYESGPYYRSYVAFLEGLAARVPGAAFYDFRGLLPIEDFNDWHHATYIGTIKLGAAYTELVRPGVLAATKPAAGQGG